MADRRVEIDAGSETISIRKLPPDTPGWGEQFVIETIPDDPRSDGPGSKIFVKPENALKIAQAIIWLHLNMDLKEIQG